VSIEKRYTMGDIVYNNHTGMYGKVAKGGFDEYKDDMISNIIVWENTTALIEENTRIDGNNVILVGNGTVTSIYQRSKLSILANGKMNQWFTISEYVLNNVINKTRKTKSILFI